MLPQEEARYQVQMVMAGELMAFNVAAFLDGPTTDFCGLARIDQVWLHERLRHFEMFLLPALTALLSSLQMC